jgi:cell wall-associated NlpC family hydrolase
MLTRKTVTDTALQWLGTPWYSNQSEKGIGCDCVGFLSGVGKEVGFLGQDYTIRNHLNYDRNGEIEKELDRLFIPTKELVSANIILFRKLGIVTHVGIALDGETFIHASEISQLGVRVSSLEFFRQVIHKIYQIPGIV